MKFDINRSSYCLLRFVTRKKRKRVTTTLRITRSLTYGIFHSENVNPRITGLQHLCVTTDSLIWENNNIYIRTYRHGKKETITWYVVRGTIVNTMVPGSSRTYGTHKNRSMNPFLPSADNIWSYLLWSPVLRTRYGTAVQQSFARSEGETNHRQPLLL